MILKQNFKPRFKDTMSLKMTSTDKIISKYYLTYYLKTNLQILTIPQLPSLKTKNYSIKSSPLTME